MQFKQRFASMSSHFFNGCYCNNTVDHYSILVFIINFTFTCYSTDVRSSMMALLPHCHPEAIIEAASVASVSQILLCNSDASFAASGGDSGRQEEAEVPPN